MGNEIKLLRFCFVLSYGLNLNRQSDRSEMPIMMSKGGASLCQLITDPTGYSVMSSSAMDISGVDKWADTFFIMEWNAAGISFPFDSDRFSKLQS